MRPDMAKVITERARAGPRLKTIKGSKKKLQGDIEELPKTEKMLDKRNGTKVFTDVLGPLRGYVLSVIGRPFSLVFSEISKVLKPTGLSGSHAQDHLWQMLLTKVVIDKEGNPCFADLTYSSRYSNSMRIYAGRNYNIAYVDPRDGIIKRCPERKKTPKEEKPVVRHTIDENNQCHKIDGIWYWIKVKPVVYKYVREKYEIRNHTGWTNRFIKYVDMLIGLVNHPYNVTDFYGGAYKAISKRQMNKREIKKYKLK